MALGCSVEFLGLRVEGLVKNLRLVALGFGVQGLVLSL